ncbi:unnamed protein product, partial [Mesorhabditis belari]|uniref:Phosphatidic acid phosphatase type 2/haloperoxidase domain-containing protein n=1 Tax=Mesorhabditis belari TaxID=2138241 RepID=A0AAF3FNY5_9BILA
MIDDIIVSQMAIVILLIARYFVMQIPFTELGFNCADTDISWPAKEETISSHTMFIIFASIILVMIPLTEMTMVKTTSGKIRHIQIHRFAVHPYFLKVWFFISAFGCAALATSVAANLFKRTSSRLRPNFLDTCQPANLSLLCPPCSQNYIATVTCMAETSRDEHYSFPSGHAAHSANLAIFTILYLHKRMKLWPIVRAFAQYVLFVLTIWISLTRVRDFKHRFTDVIGGYFFGAVIGFGMIHLILRHFKHYRYRVHEEEITIDGSISQSPTPPNYGAFHHAKSIACLVE